MRVIILFLCLCSVLGFAESRGSAEFRPHSQRNNSATSEALSPDGNHGASRGAIQIAQVDQNSATPKARTEASPPPDWKNLASRANDRAKEVLPEVEKALRDIEWSDGKRFNHPKWDVDKFVQRMLPEMAKSIEGINATVNRGANPPAFSESIKAGLIRLDELEILAKYVSFYEKLAKNPPVEAENLTKEERDALLRKKASRATYDYFQEGKKYEKWSMDLVGAKDYANKLKFYFATPPDELYKDGGEHIDANRGMILNVMAIRNLAYGSNPPK